MVAGSTLLSVLMVSGTMFADALFPGIGFGGYGQNQGMVIGGGGYGGGGYGGGGYLCGQVQCQTQIQCDSCDYPQPFVQQVSYSRSVLTRVEEFVQTIGRVAINVPGRLIDSSISIPAGLIDVSLRTGMTLVTDISTAIENLNAFISHEVVGRIAYDITTDLSDSLSVVRKLVSWCGTATTGTVVVPIPQEIVVRYQNPPTWNNQCSGAWPCTTLQPSVYASQGQQYQYANKFGYGSQWNRGNTKIINSNYDSGNAFGYGDTGSSGQQYNNYQQQGGAAPSGGGSGPSPSYAPTGYSAGGIGNILSGIGGLGGARSVGERRSKKHRAP